jgi:beta-galactosidase
VWRQAAEVYLNGVWLGRCANGVMAFGFDLTPHLRPGEKVLAVRTDNSFSYREKATNSPVQWNNSTFYSNFGGINKSVRLHIMPAIYQTLPLYSSLGTTGQYIWADHFDDYLQVFPSTRGRSDQIISRTNKFQSMKPLWLRAAPVSGW